MVSYMVSFINKLITLQCTMHNQPICFQCFIILLKGLVVIIVVLYPPSLSVIIPTKPWFVAFPPLGITQKHEYIFSLLMTGCGIYSSFILHWVIDDYWLRCCYWCVGYFTVIRNSILIQLYHSICPSQPSGELFSRLSCCIQLFFMYLCCLIDIGYDRTLGLS